MTSLDATQTGAAALAATEQAAIAQRFLQRIADDPDAVEDNLDALLGGGSSPLPPIPVMVTITVKGQSPVELDVNPDNVNLEKSSNTHASKTNRQQSSTTTGTGGFKNAMVGQTQFKGATPGTLTLTGAVLGSPTGVRDISGDIETLTGALVPPPGDETTSKPPLVEFKYGKWRPMPYAYLSTLKLKMTDWATDGTPVRAEIQTLILTEAPSPQGGQNPTSGAFGSRKTHTVIAGDSLASIAYQVYGRPDYWRAIADANGIDDPLRLRTGTELLIPPREYAKGKK